MTGARLRRLTVTSAGVAPAGRPSRDTAAPGGVEVTRMRCEGPFIWRVAQFADTRTAAASAKRRTR